MTQPFSDITIGNSDGFDAESLDTSMSPAELRNSEQRRKVLEGYANAHAPVRATVDVRLNPNIRSAFALNPDVGQNPEATDSDFSPRDLLGTDADYVIYVTGKETPIPLEETPYESEYVLDYAAQCAYILHEIGHVKFTDFKSYARILSDLCEDYKPPAVEEAAQRLFNIFEDGTIERAVRLETTERAAERQKLLNHFLRIPFTERTFSWIDAINTGAIDLAIYDTDTLRKLLDPANTDLVFADRSHRQVFINLLPALAELRNTVLHTPDPETRYQHIADFWTTYVDPLLSSPDDDAAEQTQSGQNQSGQEQESGDSQQSQTDQNQSGQSQRSNQNHHPDQNQQSGKTENGESQQSDESHSGSTPESDSDNTSSEVEQTSASSSSEDVAETEQSAGGADSESPQSESGSQSGEQSDPQSDTAPPEAAQETPNESQTASDESAGEELQDGQDVNDGDIKRSTQEAGGSDSTLPEDIPSPTDGDGSVSSEHFPDDFSRAANSDDTNIENETPADSTQPADNMPAPTSDQGEHSARSEDATTQQDDTSTYTGRSDQAPQLSEGENADQSDGDHPNNDSGPLTDNTDSTEEGDREDAAQNNSETAEGSDSAGPESSSQELGDADDTNSQDESPTEDDVQSDSGKDSTSQVSQSLGRDESGAEQEDAASDTQGQTSFDDFLEQDPEQSSHSEGQQSESGEETDTTADTPSDQTPSESPDTNEQSDRGAGEQPTSERDSQTSGEPTGQETGSGDEQRTSEPDTAPDGASTSESSEDAHTGSEDTAQSESSTPTPDIPGGDGDLELDDKYVEAETEVAEQDTADEGVSPELDRELDRLEQTLEELTREYDATSKSGSGGGTGAGSGIHQDTLQVMPTSGEDARNTDRWKEAVSESKHTGQSLKQALNNTQRDDISRGRSSGRYDSGRATAHAVGKTTYFKQRHFGGDRKYVLIIVLDRSASMDPHRGPSLINPAEKAVSQFALAAEDIGIEVCVLDFYNGKIRVPSPFGTRVKHTADSLVTSDAKGGTPLSDTLAMGRERVKQEASRNLHPLMLVVTDGKPSNKDEYLSELQRTNQEIQSIMGLTLSPNTDPHDPPQKFAEQEQYFNSHEFVTAPSSEEITQKLEDLALRADSPTQ